MWTTSPLRLTAHLVQALLFLLFVLHVPHARREVPEAHVGVLRLGQCEMGRRNDSSVNHYALHMNAHTHSLARAHTRWCTHQIELERQAGKKSIRETMEYWNPLRLYKIESSQSNHGCQFIKPAQCILSNSHPDKRTLL